MCLNLPHTGSHLIAYEKTENEEKYRYIITVEWFLKEVNKERDTLAFKRKLNLGEAPVGIPYITGVSLTKFHVFCTVISYLSTLM